MVMKKVNLLIFLLQNKWKCELIDSEHQKNIYLLFSKKRENMELVSCRTGITIGSPNCLFITEKIHTTINKLGGT